jgi:hypothetical protein
MKKIYSIFLLSAVALHATSPKSAQISAGSKTTKVTQTETTSGIGDVIEIERLAATKKALDDAVTAKKKELADAKAALDAKAAKLKAEIAQLQKERDDLIKDLKGGFYCTKCGRTKSYFENRGESFEKHLVDVQARAEPAPTSTLEQKRDEYSQKIAYKRVQLKNLETNDKDVPAKKKQLEEAEKKVKDLCDLITKRSQAYGKTLEGETKSKHQTWLKELLSYASDIYIAEDRVFIYQGRKAAELKDFEKRSAQARIDAENANKAQRDQRESRIAVINGQIPEMEEGLRGRLAPLEAQKAAATKRIVEIDALLRAVTMKADERAALVAERSALAAQNAQTTRTINAQNAAHNKTVQSLRSEEMRLRGEISRLMSNVTLEQNAAVAKLRPAHLARLAAIDKLIAAANVDLTNARNTYKTKETFYSGENTKFLDLVSTESNRIVVAGRATTCPVANEARQFVASNWNKLLPCVSGATTRAKPYGTNVFGSYCPAEVSASALGKYKSFLRSLSPEDVAIIKGNSNVDWFDDVTKP